MSSLPGYELEDYVTWNHDLIVDEHARPNYVNITKDQFADIIKLYEPFREEVELALLDFDEENQSWRSYSSYAFDSIPKSVYESAARLIRDMTTAKE
jgi:hypothetical protein